MDISFGETCGCKGYSVRSDILSEYGPSMANSCGGGNFVVFMTILEAFIRGRCDLSDPCNRVKPHSEPDYEYDFIVAGGGTAGAVVASRLSENPKWKVLLVEAGGDEPPAAAVPSMIASYWGDPAMDWNYRTEPESNACLGEPEQRCSWTRGKVLGGCSVTNGMMYMRGHKRDYDDWEKSGARGWAWKDVLPFFKVSEDNRQIGTLVSSEFHGSGGYLTTQQFPHQPAIAKDILNAAEEIGYGVTNDLNGDNFKGFTTAQTNNRNGSRMSTATAFLRPASGRSNLHVMLNSTATRVVIDPTTKVVFGLEFMYKGKKKVAKSSKEVILSAGALNSPQLLLLSGIGPKEDLTKLNIPVIHHLPGVGKNLHNHVASFVDFKLNKENATQSLNWATAMEYMLKRTGALSSTGLSQMTGVLNSKYAEPNGNHPDVQMFFSGYLAGCSRTGQLFEPLNTNNEDEKTTISIRPVYLHPKSRGYLTLASKDPTAPPLMYPNYLTEPEDIDVLVESIKMALKFGESKILSEKYGIEADKTPIPECASQGEWGTDAYWRCMVKVATGPENHQVGTCKMGSPQDSLAVVSNELRVFGIKGLRVIDASIMPIVPSGNTAAPTIMIAERGSAFIKNMWNWNKPPIVHDHFSSTDLKRNCGGVRTDTNDVKIDIQTQEREVVDWHKRHVHL
ncbi:glucose dehydrogenase [FAD, quinone]-like [Arctopsyche grandis]|uniref:glucose dehydrogenase [FAD, quinone]-like n=1 Tax=Arctopsyche grandis TaxID=121162 RepID=UPI00406D9BF6